MPALNVVLLCACSVILTGICACSPEGGDSQVPAAKDALPADLQAMQGSWSAGTTNECVECNVVFRGYTVRLRYQKTADDPLMKKNVSFESVDEQRHLLIMHGTGGIWSYGFHSDEKGERLDLEFYAPGQSVQSQISMRRDP